MTFTEHLINYAKNELKITNFDQSELGDIIIKFLESSAKITNNDPNSMKQLVSMLEKLIDQAPVSPITEEDFVEELYPEGDKFLKLWRCTRYQYLYKTEDGKYWDDRAIIYKFSDSNDADQLYLYQSGFCSKQEVTLPYYPNPQIKVISRNDIS